MLKELAILKASTGNVEGSEVTRWFPGSAGE